jgi:outer membrane protein assembly factor BamA
MRSSAPAQLHEILLGQGRGPLELVAEKHCRCDTANIEVGKGASLAYKITPICLVPYIMNLSSFLWRTWILVTIILAFLGPMGQAQQPTIGRSPQLPTRQNPPIVRTIEIQYAGPATLSRQRVLSNMKTTVGQPYSELRVEDDVRALYATGLVTNVRIYGEPVPDGLKVIVVVQTRVTLTEVTIQGNETIKTKRIRREMKTKENNILGFLTGAGRLNNQQLGSDVQKIKERYQDNGYVDVQITDVRIDRLDNKSVAITVHIGH